MHEKHDFTKRIIAVNRVEYEDHKIKAVVTTDHFGRVTTKPYTFSLEDWAEIVERGWIE